MVRARVGMLSLILALGTSSLFATCGGGGGGGGGSQSAYQTTWSEYDAAYAQAKEKSLGVLLYFEREQDGEHSLFASKPIADQSKDTPMVKVAGEHLDKLRGEFGAPKDKHVLVVTDWHGNRIATYTAERKTTSLDIKPLMAAIASAKKFFAKVEKDAKDFYKKGMTQFDKKKWGPAAKEFVKVAAFKGVEEAGQAGERLEAIQETGTKEIAAILAETDTDVGAKVVALTKLTKEYKGTNVEPLAEDEIAKLKGDKKAQNTVPYDAAMLLAEWRAEFEFEAIDVAAIDRSLRLQQKVFEGALAERMHEYDRALASYEAALTFDPSDCVARRYLGEYHRHHTGDWALAREHFDRIVADPRADRYSRAIALHGIGKMTIHGGEFQRGVAIIEQSVDVFPTQLAYRNLAVYWHSEGEFEKALAYVRQAVALAPTDPYTRVFEAVYLAFGGDHELALRQVAETPFDLSMSYNVACIYSAMRDKERTLRLLEQHFQEYEFTDRVRAKEMWEARTDINFKWLLEDPDFRRITHLAQEG
ncbi:MAG: tetratricopeptide repeat protein [Planctomycetota bacterium]